MVFNGNKVWVAVDENKKPVVTNGKVLIKYQIDQDYEYRVFEKSLKQLDSLESGNNRQKRNSGEKRKKKSETKAVFSSEPLPENAICIYTDGASSGNPGPSGIGVLLRFDRHEKTISKFIGNATNNIAELEAIKAGLQELKRTDLPVRIFTDSGYAFGLLSKGWKAKKNIDLVQSIKELMTKFSDIKFIKVKGHAGFEDNERADLLATSAIKNSNKLNDTAK